MPENRPEWTIFSWRGLRMQVPLDWELGAFDGEEASGYLRLDDLYLPRLEIRWKRAGKSASVNLAAQNYLKSLSQGRKKNSRPQQVPRPLSLGVSWQDGLEVRCYRWRGQSECVAAVIHCRSCRRLSVVQIFFAPGKYSAALCKRILGSLHDHNPPEVTCWDFYLLHLRVPSSWQLQGHKFNPGYAELSFTGPNKLQVDFRRWGPASVLLQGKDLEEWARQNWPTGLKADSVHGHNRDGDLAQVARRNGSGVFGPLQRFLGRGPAIRKALFWHSTVWHCPGSARLWMVDVFARTGPEAAGANWQVLCHQQPTI